MSGQIYLMASKREKFTQRSFRLVGETVLKTVMALLPNLPLDDEKVCTKCKAKKSTAEFSKNVNKKDGRKFQCKACDKKEIAEYRAKFPDKVKASHAAQYAANAEKLKKKRRGAYSANPQKFRDISAAWGKRNAEKRRASAKVYRKENPKKVKAAFMVWQSKNKDALREYRVAFAKANPELMRVKWRARRAKKRSAEGTHTVNDVMVMLCLQRKRCACCKASINSCRSCCSACARRKELEGQSSITVPEM